VFLIQDNASYHKDKDIWNWFSDNRSWLTVNNLPPYSPEFNAAEPLWHHTRKQGTHNRYFATKDELGASLFSVFASMQKNPEQIRRHLNPFYWLECPFNYAQLDSSLPKHFRVENHVKRKIKKNQSYFQPTDSLR